jgi:hypothetical protein
MARSTFNGPILSGDSRFGFIRNVGYTDLVQSIQMNFANTGGNGTAGYPGGSTQFVNGNLIPNVNSPVYVQSATAYPPTVASITADAATTVYRGAVMYLPIGSQLLDILVEVGTAVGTSGSTMTAAVVNVGNQFNGTQYGSATLTVGSNAITAGTYSVTTNPDALWSTTADFTNPTGVVEPGTFSQLVFTLALTGTGTPAPNAGTLYLTARYKQLDPNIGTTTTYPYGNFD